MSCKEGYYGNMCTGCEKGWAWSNEYDCIKCENRLRYIAQGIGLFGFLILVIVFISFIMMAIKNLDLLISLIRIIVSYI